MELVVLFRTAGSRRRPPAGRAGRRIPKSAPNILLLPYGRRIPGFLRVFLCYAAKIQPKEPDRRERIAVARTIEKGRMDELGVTGKRYWDADPRPFYNAVADACCIYGYRDLEQNLQRFGWRQARRRVLRYGALSGEWVGRGRGEVRLGRRGLEVRFSYGARTIGWEELQEFVRARRC
jgi:hypothetical protein